MTEDNSLHGVLKPIIIGVATTVLATIVLYYLGYDENYDNRPTDTVHQLDPSEQERRRLEMENQFRELQEERARFEDLRRQQTEVASQAGALKRQQEETQRLAEETQRRATTYKPPVTAVPYSTTTSRRELLPPSFNCAKARTPPEIAICANSLLADADGRLGKIYWGLRHSLSETRSQSLKKQQVEWLRQRDIRLANECSTDGTLDIGCALRLWEDRIRALESMRSQVP